MRFNGKGMERNMVHGIIFMPFLRMIILTSPSVSIQVGFVDAF